MMKRMVRLGGGVALLTLLMLLVVGCSAAGSGDKVIAGGAEVLQSNESIDGDVAIFGGALEIQEGAHVGGDIAIFGGTLTVRGSVGGDVLNMGGTIYRMPETIAGEVTSFGGSVLGIDGDGGTVLSPEIVPPVLLEGEDEVAGGVPDEDGSRPPAGEQGIGEDEVVGRVPDVDGSRARVGDRGFLGTIGSAIFTLIVRGLQILVIGALALGVTLFLPDHVRRIGNAAAEAPVASASLGCLSLPALGFAMIVLVVTIVGIPIAIFLPVLFLAVAVLGWIGLGYFVGDRLLRSVDIRSPRPAAAAAIGAAGLMLVSLGSDLIPLVGWVVTPMLAMWAMGAAIVTRGGRRSYPLSGPALARERVSAMGAPPVGRTGERARPGPGAFDPTGDLLQDLARDLGIDQELQDDRESPPDTPETPVPPER